MKLKTVLFMSTMISATALQAQPTLMPSGGNVTIVQNDTLNNTTSVTLTQTTKINQFVFDSGPATTTNRGDTDVYASHRRRSNFLEGVFIPSIRQNGRDNSVLPNAGGNTGGNPTGLVYSTPAVDIGTSSSMFIPVFQSPGDPEFNVNLSGIYLPFSFGGNTGFIGGHGRNAANNTAMTAANSSFSPGVALGAQLGNTATGLTSLNLTGVAGAPENASLNGVLLVVGGKNEDNYGLGRANNDGTFTIVVRDNGSTTNNSESDGYAFAYLPANTSGITAGRVLGNGNAVTGVSSGSFTTSSIGTGLVALTIPDVTSANDGVLVVTAEGGGTNNFNNIVNFEWDGTNNRFVVETRSINSGTATVNPVLEDLGAEAMFSFAYLRTPRTDQSNSVSSLTRMTSGRVLAAETLAGFNSSTGNATTGTGGAPLLQTTASLLAGSNTAASDKLVEISWRTRTIDETSAGINPALISDVARVTGLDGEVFTLQMNYNEALLTTAGIDEISLAATGQLYLGWRDGNDWVNAVTGNSSVGPSALVNQQLSWADFVTANPSAATNLGDYLGSWGVDPANNQTWAVLNHNSDFAVIPEPSTMVMAGLGMVVCGLRLQRRKTKTTISA